MDAVSEHKRLTEECRTLRASAIRTCIGAAHVFCSVAETKLRCGCREEARCLLVRYRRWIPITEGHLRRPGHVSEAEADELWDKLGELEIRFQRVEESIESHR